MKSVTTHDAKTHLSALLREVERGDEIEIRRGDRPVARIVPANAPHHPRRPKVGTITSASVRYDADAFEPLDAAAMERLGLL